jgi:glutamate synthase domain-containing protein 1
MCGIAGIIYRNGDGEREVGRDMTRMLQAMKHRGPDSTGYALYRRGGETASATRSRRACATGAPRSRR